MRRKFMGRMAALSAATLACPLAWAQSDWPTRPIKLLVPYPPGGSLDPVARIIAQKISVTLGQPVIVENRPGANTAISAGAVNKADPDGYTLLFSSLPSHLIHTIQAPRGYDSVKDFAMVAAVSRADYMMAIHTAVPANTIPEFIAYAKANPDKLNFAISGIGNGNHLAAELFNLRTGLKITTVAYKGGGPALLDLNAGRVHAMITTSATLMPHIEAGKLRALAYTQQLPGKPPVPTFAQYGLKDIEKLEQVNIILATPNTPPAVIARLTSAIEKALQEPDARRGIENSAQIPFYLSPSAMRERLTADNITVAEIIQKANVKFE